MRPVISASHNMQIGMRTKHKVQRKEAESLAVLEDLRCLCVSIPPS